MSKFKTLEVLRTRTNAGAPPSFPQIDLAYASQCAGRRVGEAFLDPAVHAQCLESALRRHSGAVGAYVNLCLSAGSIASLGQLVPGKRICGRSCGRLLERSGQTTSDPPAAMILRIWTMRACARWTRCPAA